MQRLILILPGLISESGQSVLASPPSCLKTLSELGEVTKIDFADPSLPSYLGLSPQDQLEPGPLAVAAFGADPPDRSVHFQLSLVSLVDQELCSLTAPITEAELEIVTSSLRRLNTSKLTFVEGDGCFHALVWEDGSIELGTVNLDSLPAPFRPSLPTGDGENLLRRYIDDSINLLTDLEFNRRRVDEGLPPINCAWPWGHGFRHRVENLGLVYGVETEVESGSFALAGLARLAGLRHGNWRSFDRGTATPLSRLASPKSLLIAIVGAFERFRRSNEMEEMEWFLGELDRVVLGPWTALEEPTEVTVVALGDESGLALTWSSTVRHERQMPFDERALDENLKRMPLHELVRKTAH